MFICTHAKLFYVYVHVRLHVDSRTETLAEFPTGVSLLQKRIWKLDFYHCSSCNFFFHICFCHLWCELRLLPYTSTVPVKLQDLRPLPCFTKLSIGTGLWLKVGDSYKCECYAFYKIPRHLQKCAMEDFCWQRFGAKALTYRASMISAH